jgi:hypothetical protein
VITFVVEFVNHSIRILIIRITTSSSYATPFCCNGNWNCILFTLIDKICIRDSPYSLCIHICSYDSLCLSEQYCIKKDYCMFNKFHWFTKLPTVVLYHIIHFIWMKYQWIFVSYFECAQVHCLFQFLVL